MILMLIVVLGCQPYIPQDNTNNGQTYVIKDNNLPTFSSGKELLKAFEDAQQNRGRGFPELAIFKSFATTAESAPVTSADASASVDFSETNIQVAGVDEADIIKTDGEYIYAVAQNILYIIKAYPASQVEIVSQIDLDRFSPRELFIQKNRVLIFGSQSYEFDIQEPTPIIGEILRIAPRYPSYYSTMAVKLIDTSIKTQPKIIKTIDIEGNYLTSRKIDNYAYFVVNTYPRYFDNPRDCVEILPKLYESASTLDPQQEDFIPIARCTDIGYIEDVKASQFITIASISLESGELEKQVIVGSGENVYASQNNIYIAQTDYANYGGIGNPVEEDEEKTVITKFAIENGDIFYQNTGSVKGTILNQFSMDEFENHFRIATTRGNVWDEPQKSTNNIYILNQDLEQVSEVEDLAPGEKIYSVRFMGKKGYIVTFKKVDPLFVIDLDPEDPSVLGKLKIPGYSDYLHPYDENHLIGIGKDTVEAEESLQNQRNLNFAWYQGIKMAIFDVSDVNNPIELHKVIIGDRGTESEALHDHKAFLFDKEKNLLVLPITLAKIKGEKSRDNQYGDFVFQGAYVYDLTLKDGFQLRGEVSHYDDPEIYLKSGYYFNGDANIRRSLYIENFLYTFSNARLQLNNLKTLVKEKIVPFKTQEKPIIYYEEDVVTIQSLP